MKNIKKLYGITVAMITPFDEHDQVDLEKLAALTEMLIKKGVHCLYPCGTTGEMLRLSVAERKAAAETVVKTAAGRVPVYIHCGAMQEADTEELMRHAEAIGADGAGVVTPQFFTANDRELKSYYQRLAAAVPELPVYLYNIPQCAANDLSAELVKELYETCPNIIGIKYSFADINRTIDYLGTAPEFSVLHGCDRALTGMLALGCDGVVSGVSCVFPELFTAVYDAYQRGDRKEAARLQKYAVRVCDVLKRGSNMAYFKAGLECRGMGPMHMRRPQLDLPEEEKQNLRRELEAIAAEAGVDILI